MSSPTPETDLILARYIGTLTPDGWTDFVEGSDSRIVKFLTDLRAGEVVTGRVPVVASASTSADMEHSADTGASLSTPIP